MAYTLQQLQQMGATPSQGASYTLDDLNKMGATPNADPASPQGIGQSLWNGAKNMATNLAAAPVTMAARAGQLAGVGIGGAASKITGNPSYYQNALNATNQPSSFAGIPVKPLNQETPESIAGEGLSTVALGAPGSGALSAPVSGALTGAAGAAGSAMQNNASPAGVASNAAIGGLLGYGAGAVGQGILNKFNAPTTMEDYLSQSGVTDQESAPATADALRNVGINDLSSKEAIVNAQNTMARNIQQANEYLTTNGSTDPITGELDEAGQRWTSRLNMLQNLNNLLPGVGKYVNAITPNLLRHGLLGATGALTGAGLLTNAIPNTISFLKDRFVGQIPNFASQ